MNNLKTKSQALFIFGTYLILAGLAGYLSNPEKAKTALLSGGLFGVLSLVCGLLLIKGRSWANLIGLGLCAMLSITFLWRATVGWTAVFNGQSEKLFASALISSMLVGALMTLRALWPNPSDR
jgi:uncharacterized membrane protein (UPF0136 family)